MIYTFYSYKGGVGRSMALANVAEWFSRQGLSVVMVDWDLEAPGLESFFFDRTGEAETLKAIQSSPGLIDVLVTYQRQFPTLPLPAPERPSRERVAAASSGTGAGGDGSPGGRTRETKAALEVLREYLSPLSAMLYPVRGRTPPATEGRPPGGSPAPAGADGRGPISLLTAGWRAGDRFKVYAQQVQGFDWTGFYANFQGEAFFEWMRGQLEDLGDVVLIDSRTGVTEMGGVCTRQLADVVVSFCAPNDQNLSGVTRMADSFRTAATTAARAAIDQRPVEVVVVPARVDLTGEIRDLNRFEDRFKAEVTAMPNALRAADVSLWELKIPYVTKYSYREQLVMDPGDRSEVAEVIVNAYKALAAHLAYLAPETSPLRSKLAGEIRRVLRTAPPRVAVDWGPADGAGLAGKLRDVLRMSKMEFLEIPRDPSGGEVPWVQVMGVIDQVEHLAIVATPAALESGLVRREWDYARQQGKSVTLVVRQPAPPALPIWMGSAVALDPDLRRSDLVRRLSAPGRTARVPQMAPELPKPLVARPGLFDEVKRRLLAAARRQDGFDRLALVGLGGSGKTVLATSACRDDEVVGGFDGGILWATLGPNPEDHLAQLSRLYAALTGETPRFTDRGEAADRLAEELSGRRCLIVLDDVWDARHVRPFVKGAAGVRLIVTRDRAVADALEASPLDVGPMTGEEARAMIALPLGLVPDDRSVVRLAEGLQNLPLALCLANAAIRRRIDHGDSPERAVAAVLEAAERRGVVAFDQVGPADRGLSVARSIELSLQLLTPEERTRFERFADLPSVSTTVGDLAALWGVGGEEAEASARRLASLGLLQYDPDTGRGDLPGLIRAYLASPRERGEREAVRERPARAKVESLARAGRILRGEAASPGEILELAAELKRSRRYGVARKILARAAEAADSGKDRDDALRLRIAQQRAFCTYMDPDLMSDERFDQALEILNRADDLATTRNQETLGLAGSVYKRRWQVDGQAGNLERSASFYLRGFREGCETDQGYTGINAAFVLDLLAAQEAKEERGLGAPSDTVVARRNEARKIRTLLVETLANLPKKKGYERYEEDWWFHATVAEAYFGLGRDDEALFWLRDATALPAADWQIESLARQLAAIARLREESDPEGAECAWDVLRTFLGGDANALRSASLGKLGLALSGGGFRASLFHIGVLARLAELDVLRSVEVLSCVSGGSIIGAHYYLEVRHLLQTKSDRDITREDYLQIVRKIERDFLAGVQRNIRTRVFASFTSGLRTLFMGDYSRTTYAGELFERELYARVDDGEGHEPRWLDALRIQPKGGPEDFSPKADNWRRAAKVPVLVLNATTMNTGHNWQFTASWMGEPPSGIDPEVDGNDRLRRTYYEDAPPRYRRFRLGHAVAASACVPGIFEPLTMSGLYPERVVRLVDGGVHDNQGIGGLLSEECVVLLVSDASGQMQSQGDPSPSSFAVPLRANNILQARVRSAQFRELRARRRGLLLRGLMLLHLKKDLDVVPIDWLGCDQPGSPPPTNVLTAYGVPKAVQKRLSAIRTDLDAFCDLEAYGLMLDGYRMARHQFSRDIEGFPDALGTGGWNFLSIERVMTEPREQEMAHSEFLRLLDVASHRFLKSFRLRPRISLLALMGMVFLLIGALSLFAVLVYWRSPAGIGLDAVTICSYVISVLFVILVAYSCVGVLLGVIRRKSWTEIALGFGTALFGWLAARVHLVTIDRWYLRQGRVTSERPASQA